MEVMKEEEEEEGEEESSQENDYATMFARRLHRG